MAVSSKAPPGSNFAPQNNFSPVAVADSGHVVINAPQTTPQLSRNETSGGRTSKPDAAGWHNFLVAMFALALAFGLAIYSGAAAQTRSRWTAAIAAHSAPAPAPMAASNTVPRD